jgi:hypothetical protein
VASLAHYVRRRRKPKLRLAILLFGIYVFCGCIFTLWFAMSCYKVGLKERWRWREITLVIFSWPLLWILEGKVSEKAKAFLSKRRN